ncbi:MAG: ASCH domain-containing protein [Oscillospiraceae bacterium]|jgi:ASC-1-like (ASCH) protein
MNHTMKLLKVPFDAISCGKKTIEVRCRDKKRRSIAIGDTITFFRLPECTESICTRVTALYPADTFAELYAQFDPAQLGCTGESPDSLLESISKIYTKEQELRDGVLGIGLELL